MTCSSCSRCSCKTSCDSMLPVAEDCHELPHAMRSKGCWASQGCLSPRVGGITPPYTDGWELTWWESSKAEPTRSWVPLHCSRTTLPVRRTVTAKNGFRSAFSMLSLRQDIQRVVLGSECTFSAECGQAASLIKSPPTSDVSQLSFWPFSSLHSHLGFTFYLIDP